MFLFSLKCVCISDISRSPLGRGFLTGQVKKVDDFEGRIPVVQSSHLRFISDPVCDQRATSDETYPASKKRYSNTQDGFILSYADGPAQNLKHNFAIVDALKAIADKKGVTAAQLSIAWVGSLGAHVLPLPGSSYVHACARILI